MTKQELIDMIVNNHKAGQWLNSTFNVDGINVGVKAYGKWVQRMEANCKPYWSSVECKTVKQFREQVTEGVNYLFS